MERRPKMVLQRFIVQNKTVFGPLHRKDKLIILPNFTVWESLDRLRNTYTLRKRTRHAQKANGSVICMGLTGSVF